jgi:pyruvate/2-oxoglutarate/acetoin dehydrogenase E1 component
VLVHVTELTQPQGHSTSGSHERYKSKERLAWEAEFDCNRKMREWIIAGGLAGEDELAEIEKESKAFARQARENAWKAYNDDLAVERESLLQIVGEIHAESGLAEAEALKEQLERTVNPGRLDAMRAAKKAGRLLRHDNGEARRRLLEWIARAEEANRDRFSSHLYSGSAESALQMQKSDPLYSESSRLVDGREVLQACFDAALARDERVLAFGEDVGKIGDVNQAFAGLQDKYGELRVTDTGIRESTIIGQGIGTALRGLRPIAEIQYLDYLIYALQTLSDDLACLHYRTKGGQKAPLIVRTRGHRLEGIWHSGSPISMILGALRGMYVLVPRDMTRAAGFYNTLLRSDDAALVIECLNGYRLKERLPDNVGEFTLPLGIPEVIRPGEDVTVVTYGSMCRVVMEAADELAAVGISCEVIDVQTLLPFDLHHLISYSLKKTSRIVFADEDVPGGATAYMMQKVLEEQGGFGLLDSPPVTITAKEHRPAYASDGDYFSKPNAEEVFDKIYAMLTEADPEKFPPLYS